MDDVHGKFVKYGANAKLWINKCKMLLPEIDRQRIWYEKGFGSIFEYAAKLAGLSKGQVRDALWIMKKIEDKPALLKVAEKKGIGAVRPVATIATEETQDFWADKAEEMPKHTLQVYVNESRPGTRLVQKTIQMELSQETAKKLEVIKGGRSWEEVVIELLEPQVEKPEPVEGKSAYVPMAIKKYVIKKYHGLCAFPNCCKKFDQLHHTYRFALTGIHDPDQVVPLCNSHHELAHHGLIENETKSPDQWDVREFAEVEHPKYEIDQFVQKCRNG